MSDQLRDQFLSSSLPDMSVDPTAVLAGGRRRRRNHRLAAAAGSAALATAVIVVGALAVQGMNRAAPLPPAGHGLSSTALGITPTVAPTTAAERTSQAAVPTPPTSTVAATRPPVATTAPGRTITARGDAAAFNVGGYEGLTCLLGKAGVRCDTTHQYSVPTALKQQCPVDIGSDFILGSAGRGRLLCAGDTVQGTAKFGEPGAETSWWNAGFPKVTTAEGTWASIEVGDSLALGDTSCTRTGERSIRCTLQSTSHGFQFNGSTYRLF